MKSLDSVTALIHQKFHTEPFHSLRLLYGEPIGNQVPGGTCSDKTISFVNEVRKRGFDAKFHTAFIGGKEIHRLARINLNGEVFFADVGNGWPSIYLYPEDRPVKHTCFGMTFRTEISNGIISVYHQIENEEYLQMEIILEPRPQKEIITEIKERFSSGKKYPFTNRMRFSAIVDGEFRFLRDETLYIYRENGNNEQISVSEEKWGLALLEYFGWNVKLPLLER